MLATSDQLFCTTERRRPRAKSSDSFLARNTTATPQSEAQRDESFITLRKENKLLKSHLSAAYAEIGKLKVRLIEVALGIKTRDDLTNFQSSESPYVYQTPEGELSKSVIRLKRYVMPDTSESDLSKFGEQSE